MEVACGPLEPLGYEMDVLCFLGPYPSRCRHDHDLGRIHAVQCSARCRWTVRGSTPDRTMLQEEPSAASMSG